VSVRSYTYYEAAESRRRPGPFAAAIPWALAGATVLAQIAYPLVKGEARDALTVVTVVLFFLASTSHALIWRGAAWAAGFVVVSVGVGLLVEAIGSSTGYPFGTYADSLGAKVFGVPWVIPLAWAMMAYPALIAARRLVRGRWTTPVVAAVALASWDLFLDPQMVEAGHWTFAYPTPSVVFEPGIPWTNLGGWVVVSLGLMLILDRLPRRSADDRQPAALYLWTYFSFVLANLVFFDEPRVALAGGVMMGLVAIPYAWSLWSQRA
jgi:uncharacterized membrane protein